MTSLSISQLVPRDRVKVPFSNWVPQIPTCPLQSSLSPLWIFRLPQPAGLSRAPEQHTSTASRAPPFLSSALLRPHCLGVCSEAGSLCATTTPSPQGWPKSLHPSPTPTTGGLGSTVASSPHPSLSPDGNPLPPPISSS